MLHSIRFYDPAGILMQGQENLRERFTFFLMRNLIRKFQIRDVCYFFPDINDVLKSNKFLLNSLRISYPGGSECFIFLKSSFSIRLRALKSLAARSST